MGWDMQSGICKKRFLKPAKAVPTLIRGAVLETAPTADAQRRLPGCRNLQPFCPSSFISFLSLPLHLLPSSSSSLTAEASGTHDYPSLPSTHSVHTCADLCADQISQPRITLSHSPSSLQRSLPTSHQNLLSFPASLWSSL